VLFGQVSVLLAEKFVTVPILTVKEMVHDTLPILIISMFARLPLEKKQLGLDVLLNLFLATSALK